MARVILAAHDVDTLKLSPSRPPLSAPCPVTCLSRFPPICCARPFVSTRARRHFVQANTYYTNQELERYDIFWQPQHQRASSCPQAAKQAGRWVGRQEAPPPLPSNSGQCMCIHAEPSCSLPLPLSSAVIFSSLLFSSLPVVRFAGR